MKPLRAAVIALLGYAAVLAPTASQAHGVELSLPGLSVRLPAPPLPILVPPGVSVRQVGGDYGRVYEQEPEYRREPPPRFYREDWRYEDRGYRYHDHDDWDRHEWRRHERYHEEYRHHGWDR